MEEAKTLEIKWRKAALLSLRDAYLHILEDSLANAEKVRKDIFNAIAYVAQHPEKQPIDKYKTENKGDYRAFELHSYRISYKYTSSELRILRIRHVKMKPKKH